MHLEFRTPRCGDEEKLAALCAQLGYPSGGADVVARLQGILGRDDHLVLVAVGDADQPIGWVHAFVAYRVETDAFAELGGLVVAETHRGAGIGAALLAKAEQWAVARDLKVMRVRSNVVREHAHRFYRRAGYQQTKASYLFEKPLANRADTQSKTRTI